MSALRASVLLDFKTSGTAQAKAAIQGVQSATKRMADDSRKAAQAEKVARDQAIATLRRFGQVVSEIAKGKAKAEKVAIAESLRAQKQADREAAESAKTRTRAEANAYKVMHRIRQEQARETARIERAEAKQARQIATGMRNARRGTMQTIAGMGAIGATALNEVRGFGSTLGVRSREEMVQRSLAFERNLIRLGGQAGLSDEQREATRERILSVSQRTQADPSDILAAATAAQNRFSDFTFFQENAERFAEASNALDVPMADIVGAVGEFKRQMGITSEEVPELIGAMTNAAQKGSIEFSDVSAEFASAIGTYSRVTGQTGMQGAREFLAGAEVLGAGGQGASESATLMQNLLAKLANADVQRNLRRAGVTMERDGQFVGLANLVEQLSSNRRTDTATELQGVFGRDMQANQAIGILISQYRQAQSRGAVNPLTDIANSNAIEGNAVIDRTQAALLNSTSGRARQIGVNAEIDFMRNGDALIQSMTNMAGPLARLENQFPRVAQGLDTFQTSLTNLLAVFAGLRLAGGGAVLASTVNAGAGTAMAGTAMAGAGAGSTAGSLALPAMLAALTGYGVYDMYQRGGESSYATDFLDWAGEDIRNAREQGRMRGPAGAARRSLEGMSNWTGSYNADEASSLQATLENARRALNQRGGGEALASVMQKVRDIGAQDEIMSTPEGRATWMQAQQQVNADRALMAEQTAQLQGTLREVGTQISTAVRSNPPNNGTTTAPSQ